MDTEQHAQQVSFALWIVFTQLLLVPYKRSS